MTPRSHTEALRQTASNYARHLISATLLLVMAVNFLIVIVRKSITIDETLAILVLPLHGVKYVDLLSPPEVKLEDTRYVAIGASFGAGQSHRLTSGGKAESGVVHDLKQAGSGTFRVAQERAEH